METRVGQHLTRVRGSCAIKTVLPRVPGDGRRSKGELTHLLDMPPQAWPLCILTSRPQWWPGPPSGYAHYSEWLPPFPGEASTRTSAATPQSWPWLLLLGPPRCLQSIGSELLAWPRPDTAVTMVTSGEVGEAEGGEAVSWGIIVQIWEATYLGRPHRGNEIVWRHFSHHCLILAGKKTVFVCEDMCVCVCVRARNFTNSVEACLHEVHSVTSDHMDYVRVILWLEYRAWAPEECLCVVCRKRSWWHKGRQGGDWWETALEKILKRWKQGFRWWDSD